MDKLDAVVLCLTEHNVDLFTVTFGSLLKNYPGTVIISTYCDIPEHISKMASESNNNVMTFRFMQQCPEEGLVVKAMQRAYDSNVHKMLYISSGCVVNKSLKPILSVEMGTCLFAAVPDYTYRDHKNWKAIYSHEDPKYFDKEEVANCYFNADVLMVDMKNVRRSNINIDVLFDKFYKRTYSIELGLSEFMNVLNANKPFIELNRHCNNFGDLYLYNSKSYQKSARVNHMMETESIILNFRYCKPWNPNTNFNRFTMQYPVPVYMSFVNDHKDLVSVQFRETVEKLSKTYTTLLGDVPSKVASYFRGKGG